MEEVHDKVDLDLVEDRITSHQPSFSPRLSPSIEEVLSDEELPDFEPEGYLHEFADEVLESTPARPTVPSTRRPAGKRLRETTPSPDLATYFDAYGTSNADRIRMCAAYASYLRTLQPPKVKKQKK